MDGLLPRLLVALLCTATGAVAGHIANGNRSTLIGALAGGLVGFAGVVAVDALRGWRLMRWLQDARTPRRATRPGARWAIASSGACAPSSAAPAQRLRLSRFVRDGGLTERRAAAQERPDRWCSTRAADHFALRVRAESPI
jgi:two-component system phosphate regulon sensor histidine kinase PhoR